MKVADCSFIHFVYPFTFRPETFAELVAAIDGNEKVWTQDKFPIGETLFHVADYLNAKKGHPQAARLWKLSEQNNMPLRLTRDLDCRLMADKEEIPFTFGGSQKKSAAVELALFGIGVGFLTVAVRPTDSDIPTWLAFLHYFRVMNGNHDVSLTITPPTDAKRASEFAHGAMTYTEIRDTLLGTATLPEDGSKHWWYDVFVPGRMIPFAVIFVDGMEETRARGEFLYRVRNYFRTEQTVIATAEDLQVKGNPALLPYVDGQQFVFSLEGGSFVAFDAPTDKPFFRETLPAHLRDQYFLVFLLTLHQRFALMRLSQRVAERWGGEAERAANFERIREAFLDFSARGYFVQVMQREHHHRFYRKWHQVYQLEQLYQEVRDEVREMHEYLQMKQAEKAQQIQEAQNNVITWFVAILTLTCAVFGFLGINIKGLNVPSLSLEHAFLALGAVAGIGALALILPLRRHWQVTRKVRQGRKISHRE